MANHVSGGKSDKRAIDVKAPRGLKPDEATMKVVLALAHLDATEEEIAAVLRVSASTFQDFKRRSPEVAETIERGRAEGRVSLRRCLRRMAEKNPGAAIFLAKNKLGMADKVEHANKGEIAIYIDADDAGL